LRKERITFLPEQISGFLLILFQDMDLSLHIKELLYKHDCVIIPDIGAIVANYEPADINYARKTIYPPGKSILFNRNLKYNDGLLIGHIANVTGQTIQETQSNIETTVRNIKSDITKGNRYVLEDLGYFYPDQNKNIQFQPDLKINLMLDSFGLSFVHYRNEVIPLKSLKYRNITTELHHAHYRAGIRKWIYAAAAASVVTAAVLFTIPFGPAGSRLLDISSINPIKSSRTEQILSDQNPQTSLTTNSGKLPANEQSSGISPAGSGKVIHHIIVGSYSNFGNAREQICAMRAAGWNARLLFTAAEVYRVSVFSSENLQESLEKLQNVRTGISDSAWLYSE
jgi:hypothetical protein